MSSRRALAHVLIAPALTLATAASLVALVPISVRPEPAAAASAEPPSSVSVTRARRQWVKLEALPGIVQHGAGTAGADAARAAFTATARPARRGRRVVLQVRRDDAWATVARARQDRAGRAQLAAPLAEGGRALTYRVRVVAAGGLRALPSVPVSTERWLDPTWTDEFSGTELRGEWSHRGREYVHSSRRSCAKGDPRAARVADGALRLSVILDPDATRRCRIRGRDAIPGRFSYRLNGHVGTEGAFSFRYGVAAARVKFQRRRGQHGAFWLQPAGGMYPGALGSEIDVVEYFGDRHPQGGLATFTHRYAGTRRVTRGGWVPRSTSFLRGRGDGWSRRYHVFSVEWTPSRMVFRIDGRETARMRGGISTVRQFPIFSLIPANYEIPKIRDRQLPQHMSVDWVRVWETGG